MFKIPPKCPPKRGFRSWREAFVKYAGGAAWVGLTYYLYHAAVAGVLIDEPSRNLASLHLLIAWSPLLVAEFIWERWGRAAFPLKKPLSESDAGLVDERAGAAARLEA